MSLKFFNINGVKLKVTLSPEDAEKYGINISSSDYGNRHIRQAIRDILDEARAECGFSADGDKILVQCYPLPDGECELLITRLGVVSKKDRAAISSADGVSLMEHRRGVYRFLSFEDLRFAVRASHCEQRAADLYKDDLGRYYLHIDEEFTDGISEFEIFIEYGERMNSLPIAVLSEYGTLVRKDDAIDFILLE